MTQSLHIGLPKGTLRHEYQDAVGGHADVQQVM